MEFVFTSLDYGIQDAYFYIPPHISGGTMGPVQMKNLRNPAVVELVNTGAYPDLVVSNFEITYTAREGTGVEGGYFEGRSSWLSFFHHCRIFEGRGSRLCRNFLWAR